MADIEIENEVTLSRQEAAQWLADLAKALGEGGTAEIPLAGPSVKLRVPDQVHAEIEVEVDDDEVELELELRWSTARAGTSEGQDGSSG